MAQDAVCSSRQEQTLCLQLIFHCSNTSVDLRYMGNLARYEAFTQSLSSLHDVHITSLTITSSASPEGTLDFNQRLVRARAKSIRRLLEQQYPSLFSSTDDYTVAPNPTDWSDIIALLSESSIVGRDEALRFIRTYGSQAGSLMGSQRLADSLRSVADGDTWNKMEKLIFPYLRSATLTITYTSSDASPAAAPAVVHDTIYINTTTTTAAVPDSAAIEAAVRRILASGQYTLRDTIVSPQTPLGNLPSGTVRPAVTDTPALQKRSPHPVVALKTNLLFDAATIVNFELEFPIKNRFSINLEGWCPWWIFNISGTYYALQLMQASLEFRVWLGNRTKHPLLEGWFVGVYGGAAYYDFEWQNRGIQGESYINAGLSAGYSFEIAKNWRIETSLSVGYAHNDYRDYVHRTDLGLLVWQADHTYDWIGPTKLKCSISWLIPGYPNEKKNGTKDKAKHVTELNEKGGIR